MALHFSVRKWEQNQKYYAKINFHDSDKELNFLVKSKNKAEFNEKISNLIKNCLILRN